MTHHHQPYRTACDHGRGRGTPIQHADLPKEVASFERAPVLAINLHIGLTVEQYVKRVPWIPLECQLTTCRGIYLIRPARDELQLLCEQCEKRGTSLRALVLGSLMASRISTSGSLRIPRSNQR